MAFGSILEGPSTEQLTAIVDQGMMLFISLLKDESVVVRDTTAWAIGRLVGNGHWAYFCITTPQFTILHVQKRSSFLEDWLFSKQSELFESF